MSAYSDTKTVLEARLRDQRDLRDSQAEETSEYEHFQEKARETARSLILLERNEEQLCDLDNDVAQRVSEVSRVRRRHERAVAPWKRLGVTAGVLTVGLIGAGWLMGAPVLVVFGVLAGAAAVAAVWMRLRAEADGQDALRRQEALLSQAKADRDGLARQVLPK